MCLTGECCSNSTNPHVLVLLFVPLSVGFLSLSPSLFLLNYRSPFMRLSVTSVPLHLSVSLSVSVSVLTGMAVLPVFLCGCADTAFRKCAQPTCAASLLPPTPSLCKYTISQHASSTHTHTHTHTHTLTQRHVCICVSQGLSLMSVLCFTLSSKCILKST